MCERSVKFYLGKSVPSNLRKRSLDAKTMVEKRVAVPGDANLPLGIMRPFHLILMSISLMVANQAALAAETVKLRTINSQPSFVIGTRQVELAVTELGGHMSPVTFFRDSRRPVQPYYISPWQDEKPSKMPAPVLVPLRGD